LFLAQGLVAQTSPFDAPRFDVKERVLDNGVRVLVLERPNHAGRVAARVFYKVDIAAERPGTAGLTHMLEHHLFKGTHFLGTTDWEAEREVAERVERLAREVEDEENRLKDCFRQREAFLELERPCTTPRLDSLRSAFDDAIIQHNSFIISQPDRMAYMAGGATGLTASTGRDWMKYHADLPANRLELFMWIERSRMDNPVFRQFDPEKQVVIEQIRGQFNRADAKFNRTLRSMTYEAHPYSWAHWFSDLEYATREDHWEIYHKFFTSQNTTLIVVGDIQADEVFALAERYWGDWPPARPSPRLRTVEPEPAGERRLTATAPAGPALGLNVGTPAIGHPDQPVLQVMAELLGGAKGVLMRRLGDELGLATNAAASIWTSKYPSHFSIYISARRNGDLPDLERELVATLERLADGDVSQSEIAAAASALTFSLASSFEDPGNAAARQRTTRALGCCHAGGSRPRDNTLFCAGAPGDRCAAPGCGPANCGNRRVRSPGASAARQLASGRAGRGIRPAARGHFTRRRAAD
jgi:predicted Zn-dependent peptidase